MDRPVESISQRIKVALSVRGITASELARRVGITRSSMSQYMSGKYTPRNDKIAAMSMALNINPTWLMGYDVPMDDLSGGETMEQYYLDRKTADLAQAYSSNPKLKLLFDAARYADPNDLDIVYSMLVALKKKDNKGYMDEEI